MKARLVVGTMFAVVFGIAACGGSGDPGAGPGAPLEARGGEAVAAFERDPTVVKEVDEHGAARREIPATPAEDVNPEPSAPTNYTPAAVPDKCVCCVMWAGRVECWRIPCDSPCTS